MILEKGRVGDGEGSRVGMMLGKEKECCTYGEDSVKMVMEWGRIGKDANGDGEDGAKIVTPHVVMMIKGKKRDSALQGRVESG